MRNVIIGTAGHVDHGKTALIKALTGIDTDRLQEEKKRGITIDLGFAYLPLANGEKAGIVDVPGHEKFIKNMLAGAGGIDFALLVVAADDGVMPQTREHLGILSLLDVHEGIIVLTKTDLVDEEWIDMVCTDIRECVAGTFLADAPIYPVSAYTGQGIDRLREAIVAAVDSTDSRNLAQPFRIPVDRVFSVDGFGTVITGTLIEGSLSVGDEAVIYPGGASVRVRNVQVHSQDVQTAYAGQRVAVNLAGAKKEDVQRGFTIAAPDSMKSGMMLDVKLRILRDSARTVRNGSRLHFYHGAGECLCKLVLLEQDQLGPGQEGYAQLRFTQEIAAKKGDRFVVRFYSPLETVGGGLVLDPNPTRHRRGDGNVIESLRVRELGSATDNLLQAIADSSAGFTPLADIQRQLKMDSESFQRELAKLEADGSVIRLSNRVAVDAQYKAVLGRTLQKLLADYHAANPLQAGMRRDELRSRLLPRRDPALADRLLALYAEDGLIRLDNQKAALADFTIRYSEADQVIADKIEALFRQGGYAPPSMEEVLALDPRRQKNIKQVLEAMLANGTLVMTGPQIYFYGDILRDAREKITEHIAQNGQITLAEMRDISGTSRKFALSLLEYFDRHGITKKTGDARVLSK